MKNLTGERFGRLTVVKVAFKNNRGHYKWNCRCDCGKEKVVSASELRRGSTKSCGCLRSDMGRKSFFKHGNSNHPEFENWLEMIRRCHNPKSNVYERYGGRGIKVCERWFEFENFIADMGPRPKGHTIERINNDGNYEPGNCRWATRKDQANNTKATTFLELNGVRRSLHFWSDHTGIPAASIHARLRRGWTVEKL